MPVVPSLGSYTIFELLKATSGTRQDPDPSVTGSDPGADTEHLGGGGQGKRHRQLDLHSKTVLNKQAWKHTPVNQVFHK